MGFDTGAASFRLFMIPRNLPDDAVELFAHHAAPSIDSVGEEETRGWVTGRHLLDRNINEQSAFRGEYIFLTLQQAQRKVPASLLNAECKMEELAVMAADDKPFVNKQERAEIKSSVVARLLPQMPPMIRGIDMVAHPQEKIFYANALPLKQCDLFTSMFQQTVGCGALPMTPDVMALDMCNKDSREWNPVSFSPDVPTDLMEVTPGRDFLTWLWFYSEARGGVFTLNGGENVAIMLEGPLLFTHEGDGAFETLLRKGEPINSAEAKTCLLCGKKLKQATITMAIGEEIWQFTLDADEFMFKNVKIPKIEEFMDSVSNFEERMRRLDRFVGMFLGVFEVFVAERSSTKIWSEILSDIHNWISNRICRI